MKKNTSKQTRKGCSDTANMLEGKVKTIKKGEGRREGLDFPGGLDSPAKAIVE